MLACFLGVVKAGHPYIPVDDQSSPQRLVDISQRSGAEFCLALANLPVDLEDINLVKDEKMAICGYFLNNALNGHYYPALASSGFDYRQATTVTLGAVIFCQMATVLNCRFETETLFTHKNFFSNSLVYTGIVLEGILLLCMCYVPFLQDIFDTAPLDLASWLFLFFTSALSIAG